MKKKLLNLTFVTAACANAMIFSAYVAGSSACGEQAGPTLNGHIRVSIPPMAVPYPWNSDYQSCEYHSDGFEYFHWNQLQYWQYWIATVRVTYGSDDTPFYHKRYGYLNDNDVHGINVYPTGGSCQSTGELITGGCPQFPVQLKEGVTNTIYVHLTSPMYDNYRKQVNFTKQVSVSSSGFYQAIRQGFEGTQFTSNTIIGTACY